MSSSTSCVTDGSGKAGEIAALLDDGEGAGMVIFDNLLSPVQQRNLNQLLGVPVIGEFSRGISLAIRLYGNIMSGAVIAASFS